MRGWVAGAGKAARQGEGFPPSARMPVGRGDGCRRFYEALFPVPRARALSAAARTPEAALLATHPFGRLWLEACTTSNSTGAREFFLLQLFEDRLVTALRRAWWPPERVRGR